MSTTTELLIGRTHAPSFKFVQEKEDGQGLISVSIAVEPRDWDVSDPDARETYGRDLLGDDYDHHCAYGSAQLWIDTDRNAAGLAVYRPRE